MEAGSLSRTPLMSGGFLHLTLISAVSEKGTQECPRWLEGSSLITALEAQTWVRRVSQLLSAITFILHLPCRQHCLVTNLKWSLLAGQRGTEWEDGWPEFHAVTGILYLVCCSMYQDTLSTENLFCAKYHQLNPVRVTAHWHGDQMHLYICWPQRLAITPLTSTSAVLYQMNIWLHTEEYN